MRTPFLLLLLTLALPAFSQSPADLYSAAVPGTVQLKYDLLLDQRTVEKPELVNKLLRLYKLKELGSSLNLSSGTGVVVSPDGKIVTNSHVVTLSLDAVIEARKFLIGGFDDLLNRPETAKAFSKSEIEQLVKDLTKLIVQSPAALKVQANNKETRAVRILAQNPELDLALVQSDFVDLVPQKLADSSTLKVGDDVLALGYPLGKTLEDMFLEVTTTMTKGAVSALRSATLGIQHSASITHGNSGGPLINLKGEVVGINSAGITEANNLNLAIPSNTVRKFLKDKGFEALADENALLAVGKPREVQTPVRNPSEGKGMVIVVGLTPGTKVTTIPDQGALIVPPEGNLVLYDLPFGEIQINADLPVFDKVYQPFYVYKENSVLVKGYAPGLTLRLDDSKDYVVPKDGVLDLSVTFDKPHSLIAQPGWGRGFETTVLVTDEVAYTVTFGSGGLSISSLPPGIEVVLNDRWVGEADAQGVWRRTNLPTGPYRVGVKAEFITTEVQTVVVQRELDIAAKLELVPAGELKLSSQQRPELLNLVLSDSAGQPVEVVPEQIVTLKPGTYHLKARLQDDIDVTLNESITVTAGKTIEFAIPVLAYSAAFLAEKARQEKDRADHFFYAGARAGDPFGVNLVAGVNAFPWDFKTGAGYVPHATGGILTVNQSAGYWFQKNASFLIGAGVQATLLSNRSVWTNYVGQVVDSSSMLYGFYPHLMASWFGVSLDFGYGISFASQANGNPVEPSWNATWSVGWFWNH